MASQAAPHPATFDQELSRRISNYLVSRHVPAARWLEIDCAKGVVTLRGTVHSFYHKQLCVHCCQRVAGVIRVEDQLDVCEPAEFAEPVAV